MATHKEVYEWSLDEAKRMNERDLWRESYKENCDCARTMERAIRDHYKDNRLGDCIRPLIDEYGFNRVNWVLANTVLQSHSDGRYSEDNKRWARSFHIPRDEHNWQFTVNSHPGLVNLLIGQARKAWQELGLFDRSHCQPEPPEGLDYTDKVVIVSPNFLKDKYKTPEDQLYLAEGGFGCSPGARGRKVYGKFLKDGESTHISRSDILGVINDEHLPEWAREKVAEMTAPDEEPSEGITMGGI